MAILLCFTYFTTFFMCSNSKAGCIKVGVCVVKPIQSGPCEFNSIRTFKVDNVIYARKEKNSRKYFVALLTKYRSIMLLQQLSQYFFLPTFQ